MRFLREATAGGRIARFYAAPEAGHVVVYLAGPDGVFDPIAPVTLSTAAVERLAARIADGTAWREFSSVEVAA